jgi:pimeloyl-ACP methyl ester carboxylesterase
MPPLTSSPADGTALDTSQLITYLAAYIFPTSTHTLTDHLVLGVSLGGHAAWHCILHDRRITTAIVIIGCPDYFHLLSDRARLSKLPSWTVSTPPGATFIGSQDFPPALVDAVRQYDPAGLFLGPLSARPRSLTSGPAAGEAQAGLRSLLDATLRGKRILCLSGGADKLVPYASSADFLAWLKAAIAPGSWYADGGVVLEDEVFEGVGHELSAGMVAASLRFITQALEERHGSGERIRGAL